MTPPSKLESAPADRPPGMHVVLDARPLHDPARSPATARTRAYVAAETRRVYADVGIRR